MELEKSKQNEDLIRLPKRDEKTGKSSKISKEHRDLITGGKTKLEIEKFTDESTYKAVMDAKEYYDLWQASEDQLIQKLAEQSDLHDEINSILLDRAELSLELLSSEKNENIPRKYMEVEILKYNGNRRRTLFIKALKMKKKKKSKNNEGRARKRTCSQDIQNEMQKHPGGKQYRTVILKKEKS